MKELVSYSRPVPALAGRGKVNYFYTDSHALRGTTNDGQSRQRILSLREKSYSYTLKPDTSKLKTFSY